MMIQEEVLLAQAQAQTVTAEQLSIAVGKLPTKAENVGDLVGVLPEALQKLCVLHILLEVSTEELAKKLEVACHDAKSMEAEEAPPELVRLLDEAKAMVREKREFSKVVRAEMEAAFPEIKGEVVCLREGWELFYPFPVCELCGHRHPMGDSLVPTTIVIEVEFEEAPEEALSTAN